MWFSSFFIINALFFFTIVFSTIKSRKELQTFYFLPVLLFVFGSDDWKPLSLFLYALFFFHVCVLQTAEP